MSAAEEREGSSPGCGGVEAQGPRDLAGYETVFTNAKAGMEGVDKEAVKRVVWEMSQGSRFFANEERKDASVQARLAALQAARTKMTPQQLQHLAKLAARQMAELERGRTLSHTWLHVDMDAFYAAVETLENRALRGKPMAVGGTAMICTANYEARKFGVRAAMPGFIALKLCPHLVFVRPNFDKYQRYCSISREVFREFDPSFISRSLDEAYLDITEVCRRRCLPATQVASELRAKVCAATGGLTCSAGIGANRLLAKVCADINKPNGQYALPNDRDVILEFMATLPIRKVCGIGRVTERLLREAVGISVCGQLVSEAATLYGLFSKISADFFLAVGLGIGGEERPEEEARKSVSCERTFKPQTRMPPILDKLEDIAASLAGDMAELQLRGRTLTLKLKAADFRTVTRAVSVEYPVATKDEILPLAVRLLKAEKPPSLRLIGLRLSNLVSETEVHREGGGRVQARLEQFLGRKTEGQGRKGEEGLSEGGSEDFLAGVESCWEGGRGGGEGDACCPAPGKGDGVCGGEGELGTHEWEEPAADWAVGASRVALANGAAVHPLQPVADPGGGNDEPWQCQEGDKRNQAGAGRQGTKQGEDHHGREDDPGGILSQDTLQPAHPKKQGVPHAVPGGGAGKTPRQAQMTIDSMLSRRVGKRPKVPGSTCSGASTSTRQEGARSCTGSGSVEAGKAGAGPEVSSMPRFQCSECGDSIPETKKGEHADYHFALGLEQENHAWVREHAASLVHQSSHRGGKRRKSSKAASRT